MKQCGSPALQAPSRERVRAALDIAVDALKRIAAGRHQYPSADPEATLADFCADADETLTRIRTLVPNAGDD